MKASQALSTMAKVVRFFREDNKEIGGFFAQATEEGNQHEKEFVTKEAKLQMPNTKKLVKALEKARRLVVDSTTKVDVQVDATNKDADGTHTETQGEENITTKSVVET
ncbi:hypothetical protein V6N11_022862 [Hibiscus sabdariffa]|uniref:Uncharacterized protein n=1 Tax=Hibiscus sabdariffa TaxID=183260 RepID=A0ABR2TKF0_9ROSI